MGALPVSVVTDALNVGGSVLKALGGLFGANHCVSAQSILEDPFWPMQANHDGKDKCWQRHIVNWLIARGFTEGTERMNQGIEFLLKRKQLHDSGFLFARSSMSRKIWAEGSHYDIDLFTEGLVDYCRKEEPQYAQCYPYDSMGGTLMKREKTLLGDKTTPTVANSVVTSGIGGIAIVGVVALLGLSIIGRK